MDDCTKVYFLCPGSLPYIIVLFLCIVTTTASHLCLKKGAASPSWTRLPFFNTWTATGLILLGGVTVMAVYALQMIELKVFTAWTALIYLLVPLCAAALFKEKFTPRRTVGSALIVVGIFMFQY